MELLERFRIGMEALEIGINQAEEELVDTDTIEPVQWWDTDAEEDRNDEILDSMANPHLPFTLTPRP